MVDVPPNASLGDLDDPLAMLVDDPGAFAADAWDRAPYLARSRQAARLVDVGELDELLTRHVLRSPTDMRMTLGGQTVPVDAFARPVRFSNGTFAAEPAVDADAAANLFRDGATLVFLGLHRHLAHVAQFVAALTDRLGHPTGVNAYLAPAGALGGLHHDPHDVFIVQVIGNKRWTIHEPVVAWPTASLSASQGTAGPVCWDGLLQPGDTLYLPRGHAHLGNAVTTSLHLTVSVHALVWSDLLEVLMAGLVAEERWRRALPIPHRGDALGRAAARAELLARADALITDLGPLLVERSRAAALTLAKRGRTSAATPQPGRLSELVIGPDPTPDTELAADAESGWEIIPEPPFVRARAGSCEVMLPAPLEPTLWRLARGERCRVDELDAGRGPDVAAAAARILLRSGLVRRQADRK